MTQAQTTSVPASVLDHVLTLQFAIAWAGERGEEPRLGWWRIDLNSEFGGQDLFSRLLPSTWEWAVFQGMREAARRHDAEQRSREHDPDLLISLFCLGFDIDEQVGARLSELKRIGNSPTDALPGLQDVISDTWDQDRFSEWLAGHGSVGFTAVPAGRRLKGKCPDSLELTLQHLIAGLQPLGDHYPLPHYRRGR